MTEKTRGKAPSEKEASLDFNIVLLDVRGRPIVEPRPTQEQRAAMRRAQMLIANRTTPIDEARKAADDLARIERDEVRDIPLTLGDVCINALRGNAKAKEHSARQHNNRAILAIRIANGYDPEDPEDDGEYGRMPITENKRRLINSLVKETYENPIITARVSALLRTGDQTDIEWDWADEDGDE